MAALPPEQHGFLKRSLAVLITLGLVMGNGIDFGSGCSGIDIFFPAINMLWEVLSMTFGMEQVRLNHLWSCDILASRQRWLRDVMAVGTVFTDLMALPTGRAFDCVSGRLRKVRKIFLFACGFSCKSVSKANNDCKAFVGCLKAALGTTGKTFNAAMATIRLLLPILVLMENVQGLSQADRDYVVRELEKMGYLVAVIISDLQWHGLPCRRVRVWFIACLQPGATDEQRTSTQEAAVNYERLLRRSPRFGLSSFLMTPSDSDFDHHLQDHLMKRKKHNITGVKWRGLHKTLWSGSRKPQFPASFKGMFQKYSFTAREKDLIRLELAHNTQDYDKEEGEFILYDVSQSANRIPRGVAVGPTILPNGKMVIAQYPGQEPRPLFGIEALALQGFNLSMLPEEAAEVAKSSFNGRFYLDAAGNAYSVPQAQLAVVVAMCIFELPADLGEVAERRAAAKRLRRR
jgi:site-specific DNA-cytosine methylase